MCPALVPSLSFIQSCPHCQACLQRGPWTTSPGSSQFQSAGRGPYSWPSPLLGNLCRGPCSSLSVSVCFLTSATATTLHERPAHATCSLQRLWWAVSPMMRKQLLGVTAQASDSVTPVHTHSLDSSIKTQLRIPATGSHFAFPGAPFEITT